MLGLQMNSFVDVCDYDETKSHRVIASKMDIQDIMDVLIPHHVVSLASRNESTYGLDTDSEGDHDPSSLIKQPTIQENLHSLDRDPISNIFLLGTDYMDTQETQVTVTPLKVPHAPVISSFGTPTSRVGFSSTAGPSCASRSIAEKDVDLAIEAGCTASSGGGSQHAELPPM